MKCKCPMCHGDGSWIAPVLWNGIGGGPIELCGLCNHTGLVTQKRKMEWVRSFNKLRGKIIWMGTRKPTFMRPTHIEVD